MFSFILRILRSVFQDAISYVYPKPSIVSVNSRNVSSVGRNQYNTTITNSDTIEIAKHILAPASTSTLDNHLDAAYEAQCVILKKIRRQVPQVELQLECGPWVIERRDIIATDVFSHPNKNHSIILRGSYKDKRVLVQRYSQSAVKDFLRDVAAWKALSHPNFPRLIGHSAKSETHPFIVLSGVVSGNVSSYVQASLTRGNVASFMTALETMQGIASGLAYLRFTSNAGRIYLGECIKTSNILLDSGGRVILGENVVLSPPEIGEHYRPVDNEGALADQFWYLTKEIIFGSDASCDNLSDADYQGPASHLRSILSLAGWHSEPATITSITNKLNFMLTNLTDLRHQTGRISFYDIQQCLLRLENHTHDRDYDPPEVWDVSIGDIGYVKDQTFVFLCNVLDEVELKVTQEDVFMVNCDPPNGVSTNHISEKLIRHEFNGPTFVGVRRLNQKTSRDTATALRHLLAHSTTYLEKYELHELCLHDIIMVTGIILGFRAGTYEYKPVEDGSSRQPDKVYLFEETDTTVMPWAFWALEEDPDNTAAILPGSDLSIVTTTVQYLQTINYVQLNRAIELPGNDS